MNRKQRKFVIIFFAALLVISVEINDFGTQRTYAEKDFHFTERVSIAIVAASVPYQQH